MCLLFVIVVCLFLLGIRVVGLGISLFVCIMRGRFRGGCCGWIVGGVGLAVVVFGWRIVRWCFICGVVVMVGYA